MFKSLCKDKKADEIKIILDSCVHKIRPYGSVFKKTKSNLALFKICLKNHLITDILDFVDKDLATKYKKFRNNFKYNYSNNFVKKIFNKFS